MSCVPVLGQSFPRSNELFVTNFHVIQLEKLKTWVSRSRWKMYNLRWLLPATDPRSKRRWVELVKANSAASAPLPEFVETMKSKLVDSMRPGNWIYEIKFDGYCALALGGGQREGRTCEM